MKFLPELEQIILKFIWNHRSPQFAKETLKKKKKRARLEILPSHTNLQSYSNQDCMVLAEGLTHRENEEPSNRLT